MTVNVQRNGCNNVIYGFYGLILGFVFLVACQKAYAQQPAPADYLILQYIGNYQSSGKGRCGFGPGLMGASPHFSADHSDTTCRTGYYYVAGDLAVSIQVIAHAGSDSDKWLLHEVDKEFRTYYGLVDPSYMIRAINDNAIMTFGSAGWDYRWISGNIVIDIEYHDTMMSKPEPLEVVNAYLAKYPSTLPAMTSAEIRSNESKTAWIKDEMDRRLWLCDKWFYQLQLSKVQQTDALQAVVKNMNVFLDYREKYFGLKAADEKNLLAGYLNTNNGTGIKAKLTEYKNWWTVNKGNAISLP